MPPLDTAVQSIIFWFIGFVNHLISRFFRLSHQDRKQTDTVAALINR